MSKKSTLNRHRFIIELDRVVHPVVLAELKQVIEKARARSGESPQPAPSTKHEISPYQVRVSREIGQIKQVVHNLKISLYLLRRYPQGEFEHTNTLPHQDWLYYHYAAFITGFVTAYDISLLLTNSIFQLGIPEERCHNEVIRENSHVKITPVYGSLRGLEKIVNRYRLPRHKFIHRGIRPDLEEVFSYAVQPLLSPEKQMDSITPTFPRRLVDQVAKRLNRDVADLEKALCRFLDVLYPIYESRVKVDLHGESA
jgi:Cthe_2314-like HEPN